MKRINSGFFWASFTDLMTSLFFVMLVLYVLTFVKLYNQQKATERELNKIKEIQAAVSELPKEYFDYQPEFKRFTLKKQIEFPARLSDIKEEDHEYLRNVGKSIVDLISTLKKKYKDENIKYLIVIEGMASKDSYQGNDVLSYQRSLALAKFWKSNDIVFDESFCELQIAGSGTGGIGRVIGNEEKNQRFLIQIVPKIGNLETR